MALDDSQRNNLVAQMIRAARLDPSLYRDVAAPSGSTRQAAVVVLITAAVSGLYWGALSIPGLVLSDPAVAADAGAVLAQFAVPTIGFSAIAQVCAWLIWSAGLWLVGARLAAPAGPVRAFWPLARALAFAQSPAVFGVVTVALALVVGPIFGTEALKASFVLMLMWSVQAAVGVWVLIATFLAVRETLGLSTGRTLGSLSLVGLAISGLVSFSVVALVIAGARDALGLTGLQDLPRNMTEFGVLAVGGILVLFGSLLFFRWMQESDIGCLMGALLVPAGLAVAVLLGLNYSSVSWDSPGILGFVVPRNNAAEFSALALTGLWLIYWSLFSLRGLLQLDSTWALVPVGLVIVVLLGLGVTALALVETITPGVVGSVNDVPGAFAIATGFDFNLSFGVGHSRWLVGALSGMVLSSG